MDWAAIIQMLAGAANEVLGPIVQAIPGPMEMRYRKAIKEDLQNLANGGGGMGQGKLQELQGMARGGIAAQQAEQQAALARGAASGAAASGLQGQAAAAMAKQGLSAQRGAASDIRAQDLALAEQRRQNLFGRMENAMSLGQRAKASVSDIQPSAMVQSQGANAGAQGRNDLTQGLQQYNTGGGYGR